MVLEGRRLSLWTGVPVYAKTERREDFRKKAQKAGKRDPKGKTKGNVGQKVHFWSTLLLLTEAL